MSPVNETLRKKGELFTGGGWIDSPLVLSGGEEIIYTLGKDLRRKFYVQEDHILEVTYPTAMRTEKDKNRSL